MPSLALLLVQVPLGGVFTPASCSAGTSLREVLNRLLQGPRDFLGVGFWGELHGLADAYLNLSGRGELLPGALDFKQTLDPHRQDWDAQIVSEQAHTGTERAELAVFGVFSFRKDEHAVAAIHGLSGVGKALAEAGLARQREQVEQGDTERPLQAVVDSAEPRPIQCCARAGRAQYFERLAAGCGRQLVADARGQRKLDEADIDIGNMV